MTPDIFLSYNREDQSAAQRFAEAFEAGGLKVWWDVTLHSGDAYDQITEQALKDAAAVVVLWSPRSVVSRWVRAEATAADRNRTLVPITIAPCERPIMFELTQTADLSHWQGEPQDKAWLALLADVRRRIALSATARGPAAAIATEDEAANAATDRPRVIILPFINMSGDAEQEYFSDGVTEDIITDLGHVSALSVVSRNAAFSYKGKTVEAAEIARTLKVSHILEGSVRKAGNRVRITAQLLDAATDGQIWAERFDRTLDDIFAIQDEISMTVAAALKLHLAPAEKRAIVQRATSNPQAYELFLMARQFERTGSERMKPLIVRICRRVVELDPEFAPAWALLAFAECDLTQRSVAGASIEQAVAAARRALEIDPNLAEAHAAMAEVLGRGPTLDLAAGEPYLQTALRLDPDCYEANLYAGYFHLHQLQWDEAICFLEKACALDPEAIRPAGMVIQAYGGKGDWQNALASSRRSLARCEKLLAVEPDHGSALGFFVLALCDLGEADRARDWAARAVLFEPDNMRLHYNLACGMAKLCDADAACDLLDGMIARVSSGWLTWIESDNSLDPIRDNPRFVALMANARARQATFGEVPALDENQR